MNIYSCQISMLSVLKTGWVSYFEKRPSVISLLLLLFLYLFVFILLEGTSLFFGGWLVFEDVPKATGDNL